MTREEAVKVQAKKAERIKKLQNKLKKEQEIIHSYMLKAFLDKLKNCPK